MTRLAVPRSNLIWATRGRNWGFRFLLAGGLGDPLAEYERAFEGLMSGSSAWRRTSQIVAVRFPDPEGRRDSAGRVIPHEFVVLGAGSALVNSVDDGERELWPLVGRAFAHVWEADRAPSSAELRFE